MYISISFKYLAVTSLFSILGPKYNQASTVLGIVLGQRKLKHLKAAHTRLTNVIMMYLRAFSTTQYWSHRV